MESEKLKLIEAESRVMNTRGWVERWMRKER
jgi:hypothetical protein